MLQVQENKPIGTTIGTATVQYATEFKSLSDYIQIKETGRQGGDKILYTISTNKEIDYESVSYSFSKCVSFTKCELLKKRDF